LLLLLLRWWLCGLLCAFDPSALPGGFVATSLRLLLFVLFREWLDESIQFVELSDLANEFGGELRGDAGFSELVEPLCLADLGYRVGILSGPSGNGRTSSQHRGHQ
jgi:hypothetical protein